MNTNPASHILPIKSPLARFAPRCIKGIQSPILASCLSLAFLTPANAVDFSGSLKRVSITDAQAANKPPVAAMTYSVIGNTVSFDANGSSDPDGSIVQYTWDFGDGTTASGSSASHTFANTSDHFITLTVKDNANGVDIIQQIIRQSFVKKINFQRLTDPIPEGYLADGGNPYTSSAGYGWTVPHFYTIPPDRNNSASPDQRYDTLINVYPDSIWEIEVPRSGNYFVKIVIGDPSSPYGVHNIQAEGLPIIQDVTLKESIPWAEGEQKVFITDGKLTLTFNGSSKYARLCYIDIISTQ